MKQVLVTVTLVVKDESESHAYTTAMRKLMGPLNEWFCEPCNDILPPGTLLFWNVRTEGTGDVKR